VADARLRLVWVDAAGGSHAVDVGRTIKVGRAPECEVVLDEEGVSRIHCEIRPEGDALALVDLHSTNGTYVNGTRVRDARLRDGDRIVVGRLLLRVEESEAKARSYKTCYVGPDSIELAIDAAHSSYPPLGLSPESGTRHLHALYGILRVIGESDGAAMMLRGSLRTILDTLPLDFGHVLIGPEPPEGPREVEPELAVVAAWAKEGEAPPWSRTVVRRVLSSGQAVLANDVQSEPELASAKSVAAAKSVRIACAPIPLRGRVGVLYVAARGLSSPVLPEDVAFLNAAARQIGLAADALSERESLARENELLKKGVPVRKLIGRAEQMQRLRELVSKAALVDATVLVTGESGTGKELVARGVHDASARATQPFVALNCGALPVDVVPSELFGHERGAFTGAHARRTGLIELARGGTLFLDEVGELPLDVQVMLLRVLEEKRFFRVGGQEEVRADVRFVAATNRDLDEAVRKDAFRKDLYFRLKVVEIRTPALREHLDDLDELAPFLLGEIARSTGRPARPLSAAALERLRRHSWPGNVRELKNALERGLLLARGPEIEPDELGLGAAAPAAIVDGRPLVPLEQVERDHILRVLEATGWNKTRAAEILGVARITLYDKIRAFDLRPEA
jgi:Nif-specific regulatory protein